MHAALLPRNPRKQTIERTIAFETRSYVNAIRRGTLIWGRTFHPQRLLMFNKHVEIAVYLLTDYGVAQ